MTSSSRFATTQAFIAPVTIASCRAGSTPTRHTGARRSNPRAAPLRATAAVPVRDGAVCALANASELRRTVTDAPVVVLKLHARACRACLGVAPRFRKLARAYAGRARFVEMECGKQPELAAELGVDQLPFFAVWRSGSLVSAEAIGFSNISRLSEHVADAVK